MKTKQEIKDNYACSRGFRNWEDLKAHTRDLDNDIDELMDARANQEMERVINTTVSNWRGGYTAPRNVNDYYENKNNWDDGIKHFKEW